MIGYAKVKVNGFDFDSYAPVQGEVLDANKQEAKKFFYDKAVEYGVAINVMLFGFWLMDWWLHGGVTLMFYFFGKFFPGLMLLIEHGQLS